MIDLPPPLPTDKPPHQSPFCTSPSAIEDYFTCPRRCFYARILGLYDIASSPRQALGQVVHNALQDLLEESRVIPIDEARAAELITRRWIADEHRWGTPLKQAVFRQLAEKAVAQMARYEAGNGAGAAFVGGELDFEWAPAGSDIVLRGRIDRIDRTAEGLEVIDYKLGQHSPSINTLLSEFVPPRDAERAATWRPGDIQLPVYALAIEQGAVNGLERLPDERVAKIALVYPLELYNETGKFSAKGRREIEIVDHQSNCDACEAPPSSRPKTGLICREQLAFVERQVRDAVVLMRAGCWKPNPREGSRTCASCPFRPICTDPQ
jgi:hypothetical protein